MSGRPPQPSPPLATDHQLVPCHGNGPRMGLLAPESQTDSLLVLSDVSAIIRDYGTLDARPVQAIDTVTLSAMTFPAGSMGPKVKACIRFVTASGQSAAIGALTDVGDILADRAGTTINAERPLVTEPTR
jgi:carbamate kinase